MLLKVGTLARQTGLTIKTLHHYDAIGLLIPSHRSEAGYRMYNRDDLMRLNQIQALKQLGFALADIGDMLAGDGMALADLIPKQLAELDRQIEQSTRLRTQLLFLKNKMDRGGTPEMADLLLTLELMTMYEKYFTAEELTLLEQHRRNAVPDLDTRWATLVRSMRDLMQRGVDPAHADAQARVSEWTMLVEAMVGNDPALMIKMDAMTRNETAAQAQSGIDPVLLDYVMSCMQARHAAIYAKYLTPQELAHVLQGRTQTKAAWPPLIAAMRKLVAQGAEVSDPAVRELAARWKVLFDVTHAGDDGSLKAKLAAAYAQEPELLRGTGLDMPLLQFVGRAMALL